MALPLLAPGLLPLPWWQASLWPRGVFLTAGGVLFLVLVRRHRRIRRAEERARQLAELNRQARLRLERSWKELPPPPPPPSGLTGNPLVLDLHLSGPASLGALLGTVGSPMGRIRLWRWLLAPAEPREVELRQVRVQRLAPFLEERQELELAGLPLRARGAPPERLLQWAAQGGSVGPGPLLGVLAWVLPLATWVNFGAWLQGHAWGAFWGIPFLASIVLTWRTSPAFHQQFRAAGLGEAQLSDFRALLGAARVLQDREGPSLGGTSLGGDDVVAAEGAGLDGGASGRKDGALPALRRLAQWIHLSDLRYNAMLYTVVQPLTLWDIHVARGLAAWRARHGARLEVWLGEAAEMEALAALAALHHDHPDWAFPLIQGRGESGDRVQAVALGHPLLPTGTRVDNDLEVGPGGEFLLVTGSNMAGKSTLLRALGLNLLLAAAGAPVCARRLSLPPVRLASSVQVQDSLEDGVSLFLAELQRIREVVEGADTVGSGVDVPLYLVLLDEILRGTNSHDRRTAVRRVIRHLRERGATGLITTHDLELAGEAGLTPVHFRETVEVREQGTHMTFDYILRPGVAPTTNALLLLDAMGIRDEEPR